MPRYATKPQSPTSDPERWSLDALRGRLVELVASGAGATLTSVFDMVLDAQEAAEPVGWISATGTLFSAVDADLSGVDLEALVIVRVLNVFGAMRSAERLLRSGAFGLLVLDLGPSPRVPSSLLGKLVKLAQMHDASVICLTSAPGPQSSLGSLISLRAISRRVREGEGAFTCHLEAIKDKRFGPGWGIARSYRGPPGLR